MRRSGLRNCLAEAFVIRGDRRRYLKEIKALEWASPEDIKAWQTDRLTALLTDARREIPYYRDRAKGNGLEDFPVLSRSDIKSHRDELIVKKRKTKKTLADTTSGTTSVPISFLLSQGHRDRGAMQKVFFNEWAGLRLGEPMMKLWGIYPSKTLKGRVRNAVSNWIRNTKNLNAVNMRAADFDAYADAIQKRQPTLLLAYANSLKEMAQYLQRKGQTVDFHGRVMTSTSSLTPDKRTAIAKTFSPNIFDRYGSREMIDFACDCDCHEGLHVSPYMHVVEILDEGNRPCPPGVMGRVVVTQLFNPVMPLIRYDLGDYAQWADHACSCGRNWPLLKCVDGRSINIFHHRDGGRVSSYFFLVHVNRIIGQDRIIRQQIIQEDYHRFTIRLVLADPEAWTDREENKQRLTALISQTIGEPAEIEFDLVEDIPNQPSGKYLQTITKLGGNA